MDGNSVKHKEEIENSKARKKLRQTLWLCRTKRKLSGLD